MQIIIKVKEKTIIKVIVGRVKVSRLLIMWLINRLVTLKVRSMNRRVRPPRKINIRRVSLRSNLIHKVSQRNRAIRLWIVDLTI